MPTGTFLAHVYQAVVCPDRDSQEPGAGWCRRSIGERRNWLFPLGRTAARGCWMLPRSPGSDRQMFCCNPSSVDMLAVEVANIESGMWKRQDGHRPESRAWRFIEVNDLISCYVHAQPLRL